MEMCQFRGIFCWPTQSWAQKPFTPKINRFI